MFVAVALEELQRPEQLYAKLGCKLAVGMPFKDIATVDTILMRALPPQEDGKARQALRRLQEVGLHVIVPIEHLRENPMQDAIPLVQLADARGARSYPRGAKRCAVHQPAPRRMTCPHASQPPCDRARQASAQTCRSAQGCLQLVHLRQLQLPLNTA